MDKIIEKMLAFNKWAVVGSTNDPDKYAYKIYKILKARGYGVYSLNPGGQMVDNDNSYKTIGDLPVIPDVINMVINPIKGREILQEAIGKGIKYIWFQPGAENDELIDIAEKAGINVVHNRCILVELG